jgi:hypothetical protein
MSLDENFMIANICKRRYVSIANAGGFGRAEAAPPRRAVVVRERRRIEDIGEGE